MAHYKNPAIRQLKDQQVRYAPLDVRLEQTKQAERLLNELDPSQEYRYQELCYQITSCRSEMYPDLVVNGQDAAHDLRLFVEDLSDSADIPAESSPEKVLTVEELSKRFNVSTKTVDRWRSRGLVSRRFVFGNRKRIGFLLSSVDNFVRKYGAEIERGSRFSQLTDEERIQVIRRARRLARAGGNPSEVVRRVARILNRSAETIRYTIKNHDLDHPAAAIFPLAMKLLSEEGKREIFRSIRRGISADRLAKQFGRTKASIYRIVTEVRVRRLIDHPIEFIYHSSFEQSGAAAIILGIEPTPKVATSNVRPPPDLPPYLAEMYQVSLLTKEQEVYLFRKMNFLKFCAARLRDQLDVSRARNRDMNQIESLLRQALEVKNRLIRSNLRLVVSIAKRHVLPNANFFEMVSDGNMSLIRAIEKFDFSRGNKFSTYATWAIMKNFARSIPAEHSHQDKYRTGTDEFFLSSPDARGDHFGQLLTNQRQREAIVGILDELNEREREIIRFRFGLDCGAEPQTLEMVGARFGVTKERIRQLEVRALDKMRRIVQERHLDIPGV
ncbi:MAG: sigma-70 family RNA polymerase sigma factor [Planctomycetales bacterium]|nr:sigma-70 family RNA polymerase sigma factor [Planctomycetales bacterium]